MWGWGKKGDASPITPAPAQDVPPIPVAPAPPPFINSQSQFGEIDLLLGHVLNKSFAGRNFVVDVGARGKERSNSWDFLHSFKWRGLLIEANPALIAEINAGFAGLDFQLVSCAVSDYEGEAELTIGNNDDVSSIVAAHAESWGETHGTTKVSVRRLGPILDEHHVPHEFGLLSLDIEGEDLRVLNDLILHTPYRPLYIIIEASFDFATKSLADLPLASEVQAAYRIVGQTVANLILERA